MIQTNRAYPVLIWTCYACFKSMQTSIDLMPVRKPLLRKYLNFFRYYIYSNSETFFMRKNFWRIFVSSRNCCLRFRVLSFRKTTENSLILIAFNCGYSSIVLIMSNSQNSELKISFLSYISKAYLLSFLSFLKLLKSL
jgi:hypothetical protein